MTAHLTGQTEHHNNKGHTSAQLMTAHLTGQTEHHNNKGRTSAKLMTARSPHVADGEAPVLYEPELLPRGRSSSVQHC